MIVLLLHKRFYTKQQIEQVLCKNNKKMLSVRTQPEETFRGYLILAFIASGIVKVLQEKLTQRKFSFDDQRFKVFDDRDF